MNSDLRGLKQKLRQEFKNKLAALNETDYWKFSQSLTEQFLAQDYVKTAGLVMIYYSIKNEARTHQLIEKLLRLGKKVALPVCTPENDLEAGVVTDLAQLAPAKFGLLEPGPEAERVDQSLIDLVVVPALAFDRKGYRLGHGGGYYDRFLGRNPHLFKLGLGYDFQVVAELPREAYDVRLNALLTPGNYYEFS